MTFIPERRSSLSSGAATRAGGFKPKLELTYNSGVADEMKNKRDVGSWVGIGWSLHLGRIFYNEEKNKHYLEFGGGSYELVQLSDGTSTVDEPFTVGATTNLQLSPSSGLGAITVEGTGFTANNNVTIKWGTQILLTIPTTVPTDAAGTFTVVVSVPTTTAGNYIITATDSAATPRTAGATFTVPSLAGVGAAGPAGPRGAQGPARPTGPQGKPAPLDLLVIALILSVIAIILAA